MKIFLVVFQSTANDKDKIIVQIKAFGSWARISETTYAIKCEDIFTANIRDSLSEKFPGDVRFFVIEITDSAWASYKLPKAVTDWLKDRD